MNVAMDMGTTASRSGNETVVGDGDMDMDAMLEMRQVTKRYENFTLDHVDFVVPKGDMSPVSSGRTAPEKQRS